MRARCRVSGEDYEIVTTPITESFHDELLDTFCELRLNIASADGTEGMLIAEIEHITGSVKNQTLPDIKALFQSKLRLNMTESDVYARVLDYFNEFGKVMRANYLLSTAVATTVFARSAASCGFVASCNAEERGEAVRSLLRTSPLPRTRDCCST
ncbi:hypothetical protein PC116_g5738 [Phytophthora cactorum]|nr:hypothetical protein Pcac1_g27252 [Phytophthora cactorum]KAG3054414.1 hypothetical protein PC122_g22036 [Phytophthora cactorum]KAG3128491.1 hypothetical protein C6341_g24534 [Phytophthora cactorum]KAG4246519.1 hypothetical protein PC116_g5738 [Phytophthora cactorum]